MANHAFDTFGVTVRISRLRSEDAAGVDVEDMSATHYCAKLCSANDNLLMVFE
jgi:hypothetical protein